MSRPRTAVVVGAGAFGAGAALELAKREFDVTLVDRGPVPHHEASSTDISKLVRMDYGGDAFYADLARESMEGWDALNGESEAPPYHEDGLLLMSGRPMGPGEFEHDGFHLLLDRGVPVERRSSEDLAESHPIWNAAAYPDGYFNRRAGWAESGRAVELLIRECQRLAVKVRSEDGFARLIERDSSVRGIETASGERIVADHVIIAAGAWTPALLPWLQDVMWTRGQPVVHLQAPVDADGGYARFQAPNFPPWCADLARTGWYGFPALDDGMLKIGHHGRGVEMHPDDPKEIPPDHEARVRDFLGRTFPELVDAPIIRTRLCLYCDTFDSDFWIDRDPDREGLVVAAGGSGHGFKFAPVIGGIVADVVEERENPYRARFRWRSRGELQYEAARWTGG